MGFWQIWQTLSCFTQNWHAPWPQRKMMSFFLSTQIQHTTDSSNFRNFASSCWYCETKDLMLIPMIGLPSAKRVGANWTQYYFQPISPKSNQITIVFFPFSQNLDICESSEKSKWNKNEIQQTWKLVKNKNLRLPDISFEGPAENRPSEFGSLIEYLYYCYYYNYFHCYCNYHHHHHHHYCYHQQYLFSNNNLLLSDNSGEKWKE